ncbi:YfiT family bacillithiol transferase [Paenibacillus guangzhouensis]|uniref:YfiT family bacillithiol transferase n=1 Tax=Paenibacillus guangzhouensis TaxID=1473112 RepID=UPI001266D175|nr:putative metal-dependent hydrolase [Paenibacillus guangzhouensis]
MENRVPDLIRFPIGSFEPHVSMTDEERIQVIHQIPEISRRLRAIIEELTPDQFDTSYRQGGWTIRQIVHHLADNDMNAYIRFKRALTEDEPMANTYREDQWAELPDYQATPIEDSIALLELLHRRFYVLVWEMKPEAFRRKLRTVVVGSITLDIALQRFIWHNRHHLAQIESVRSNIN